MNASGIVVRAGERVMDANTGDVICVVKSDIYLHSPLSVGDFHEFSEGKMPWVEGALYDSRCFRSAGGGVSLFVEGTWRAGV